ncbi:DUF3326 domain-containing protein [Candidatus Micrarchaeota archaeon]|nr:DUF3326 domain-containing protein [Candidatus Micrarchaeota archaeon]
MRKKFLASFIVPTGIKASVGGYLGDATPFANLIGSVCDGVLVNPNVVNGGILNLMSEKIIYVEGTVLDHFFRGELGLSQSVGIRIGVVVEKTSDYAALALTKNTINALRAVGGVDVVGMEMTDRAVSPFASFEHNVAHGKVADLSALDEPIKKLLDMGADTIAVSTNVQATREFWEAYYKGTKPNPVGALEAVISHYVVDKFHIMAAHAPIVPSKDWDLNLRKDVVFWRAGAEALSPAYLSCILYGLSRAPRLVKPDQGISISDLSALVVPHSACGGIPMFECARRKIPIIAVKEIQTNLNVTPKSIGLDAIEVDTMHEALGVLVSLKEGIKI